MSDKPKDNKPSPIIVEYPEKLIGREIVFRLVKGGKTINFGTIKNVGKESNGTGVRPTTAPESRFQSYKPVVEELVRRGRFKPSILEIFAK